jgi:hypothetical protein
VGRPDLADLSVRLPVAVQVKYELEDLARWDRNGCGRLANDHP